MSTPVGVVSQPSQSLGRELTECLTGNCATTRQREVIETIQGRLASSGDLTLVREVLRMGQILVPLDELEEANPLTTQVALAAAELFVLAHLLPRPLSAPALNEHDEMRFDALDELLPARFEDLAHEESDTRRAWWRWQLLKLRAEDPEIAARAFESLQRAFSLDQETLAERVAGDERVLDELVRFASRQNDPLLQWRVHRLRFVDGSDSQFLQLKAAGDNAAELEAFSALRNGTAELQADPLGFAKQVRSLLDQNSSAEYFPVHGEIARSVEWLLSQYGQATPENRNLVGLGILNIIFHVSLVREYEFVLKLQGVEGLRVALLPLLAMPSPELDELVDELISIHGGTLISDDERRSFFPEESDEASDTDDDDGGL
ncbi:MAG: hypothetical protein KDD64_15530 [Bdellovibrionales bacterium]|nr:hypothetical protein [Bdellovibrionales bacterium]